MSKIFIIIGAIIFLTACQEKSIFENDKELDELISSGNERFYNKDAPGAIKYYMEALKIEDNPDVLVSLASAKLSINDATGALEDLNKAFKMKETEFYYVKRAETYVFLKQFDLALADINKALSINDKDHWAYCVRANLKFEIKNIEGALADINQALANEPSITATKATYYVYRAKMNFASGDKQKALADMNKAIEIIDSIKGDTDISNSLTSDEMSNIYQLRSDMKISLGDEKGAIEDDEKSKKLKFIKTEN